MDEVLQSKVCHLLMAATGYILTIDPAWALVFADELTDEERMIVMKTADKHKEAWS